MNDLNPILPINCQPLPAQFFERDTVAVARDLLGCHLWRYQPEAAEWLHLTVVETEAYTANDPACHAYQRTTGRAEMLYSHPGTAYVYLIYGMYDCLNVVTEPHGTAGAVLFRALEPPPGMELRTHGPGRLTKALNITRQAFNGTMLTTHASGLFLSKGQTVSDTQIVQTTRIGITKATDYPWRFYIQDNPWVSVKEKTSK